MTEAQIFREFNNPGDVPPGTYEVEVSPRLAKHWLEFYNTRNRPVKPSTVLKYAHMMGPGGGWLDQFPYGILFAPEFLMNGQHRFFAQVQSGTTRIWKIDFGVDPIFMPILDRGTGRTPDDVLNVRLGTKIPSGTVATVRQFVLGPVASTGACTDDDIHKWYAEFFDSIQFGYMCIGHARSIRFTTPSMLRALVARGYYRGEDPERLKLFAEILMTGAYPSDEPDNAASRFRLNCERGWTSGSKATVEKKYVWDRAMSAMEHFLNHRPVRLLRPRIGDAFFPGPEISGFVATPKGRHYLTKEVVGLIK